MPLNDLLCRKAKPRSKSYKLFDAGGLYLEILPSGSKYWFYKYRIDGKEKRLALGIYPAVPLMEARTLHEQARNERKRGNDPVALKKDKKQQERDEKEETLEKVTREWFRENRNKWKPDYAHEIICRLERNVFPDLGRLPIKSIKTHMLYDCLKKVEKRAPHIAKKLKQKCVEVFRYAKHKNKIEINEATDLDGAFSVKPVTHRASIDIDELPAFLTALENGRDILGPVVYLAVKIMLKTFQRRSELLKATWDEIDFDRAMWTIPGPRMKMGNEHLVPLSRQTIDDLKALYQLTGNRNHLFPKSTNPRKYIRLPIILEALTQIGYKGRMSTHGFRALAMGICKERLNYRHEVPDRQLAHVPQNEITRAYDRAKYLPQRIEMMQRYADYLDNPTQPQPTERTTAHDRQTAATIPQPYPGITASYRIHQPTGGIGASAYL
jgi:integrase